MEENKDDKKYTFVQETVKKKPLNKRKLFKRTLVTVGMAILFGLVACLTILLIEPIIDKALNPEEISKVEFPEDEEVSVDQLLTEETVKLQEEAEMDATLQEAFEEGREEAQQELSQKKEQSVGEITLENYDSIYGQLRSLANSCSGFTATIISITEEENWLQGAYLNENRTAGIILADNTAEYLILGDISGMPSSEQYRVKLSDGYLAKADLKARDRATGLAVFAVAKMGLPEATAEAISLAKLGTSTKGVEVGSPVLAIGAPQGTMGSIAYGMITASAKPLTLVDAVYNVLLTDMVGTSSASGAVIDFQGNVIGIITAGAKASFDTDTIAILGITDIKKLITNLSNGDKWGMVGVKGMDVTIEANQSDGVPFGAYVSEVMTQSPAMRAGIQNGDVIVSIGETAVHAFSDFQNAVLLLDADEILPIKVMRFNGNEYIEMELQITLGGE